MRYAIINSNQVENLDFDEVIQSVGVLRWNNDRTRAVIKFRDPTPSVISEDDVMSRSQIRAALSNSEWNPIPPE